MGIHRKNRLWIEPNWFYMAALVCVISLYLAPGVWAQQNVDDHDIFELEGDVPDGATYDGDDWDPLAVNADESLFRHEDNGVTIFTQGGSKDVNGIYQWKHTDGSVPDKDDIQNAFAAAYSVGSELLVYFGADRTANNGDANIGFWFLQDEVAPMGDGTFSGEHIDGDIFVVSGFTSGGQTSEILVYQWMGDDLTGGLVLIASATDAECAQSSTGTKLACAISNEASTGAGTGWIYTPKKGTEGIYPVASFFEGGVNVSALLGKTPCFSSFIVETRSSTSETAQLKDFVRGDFEICSVSISKTCEAGRLNETGTAFLYDVHGTVTNTGVGTLYDVTVTDTFPGTPPSTTYNLGTLDPGVTVCWPFNTSGDMYGCPADPDVFNSGTTNEPTNTARVDAAAVSGGPVVVSDEALDQCPNIPTNPSLSVTKECTTDLTFIEEESLVAVEVEFMGTVCNTGDIPLLSVVVEDITAGQTFPIGTLPAAGQEGACVSYGPATYLPSILGAPVENGRYLFTNEVVATGTPSIGYCDPDALPDPILDCEQSASATCPLCDFDQCAEEDDF